MPELSEQHVPELPKQPSVSLIKTIAARFAALFRKLSPKRKTNSKRSRSSVEKIKWPFPMASLVSHSPSVWKIGAMKPDQCVRLHHHDVRCDGQSCELTPDIANMNKAGWKITHYHEKAHVMVVRRVR